MTTKDQETGANAEALATGKPTSCELCGGNASPMYLHARCHLSAPLEAVLTGDVLELRCYLPSCNRLVAKMRIAEIL